MTRLSTLSEIRHLICGKNQSCLQAWKKPVDYTAGKAQLASFDQSVDSGVINAKILGLSLCSKFAWGPYIASFAKTLSNEIGALIRSMKFLSFEVALFLYKLYKSAIRFYSCHVWADPLSCHLNMCQINFRNGYVVLLVLHLLPFI